ncbi:helix-turn-helix domain-containing protein [Propionispira raffinosivorans]|uniref:helix-turn-helix domain-containing protein n=1 Tax=Propionispira raffinosivorans TaxID=86959 RepID=UPI000370957D|nr:helix-turn-helix transcriptional regulator [Propionispira raffinosivorans]
MLELYKRIRLKREELNLSQDELARKLGYKSRSSINKIEKGENDIPQSKIVAFAEALETTPEYLMGWENSIPISNTSSVPNLVEIIRNDSYTLAGRTPTPADRTYLSNMVDTYIDESSDQTIAAHRTDSPSADLPEEALQSIEEFKNFVRAKYKKD